MLADLAQLFDEEQLDFLFKRIESSAAACISDSKQGMLLLLKLAKVDTQVNLVISELVRCSSNSFWLL